MLKARRLKLSEASVDEIGALYRFWRDSWSEEFRSQQLVGIDTRTSDDFRSADEIRSLWVGDKIAALMLVSRFDLAREWDRTHSYFTGWPQELFEQFPAAHLRALRYFVVAPEFRGHATFKAGAIILALCYRDFLESTDDLLIGMTLKRFGADRLTHKFGMKRVGPDDQTKHGVGVEYATVLKSELNGELISRLLAGVTESEEWRFKDLFRAVSDKKTGNLA